jgi:hypothetical protein
MPSSPRPWPAEPGSSCHRTRDGLSLTGPLQARSDRLVCEIACSVCCPQVPCRMHSQCFFPPIANSLQFVSQFLRACIDDARPHMHPVSTDTLHIYGHLLSLLTLAKTGMQLRDEGAPAAPILRSFRHHHLLYMHWANHGEAPTTAGLRSRITLRVQNIDRLGNNRTHIHVSESTLVPWPACLSVSEMSHDSVLSKLGRGLTYSEGSEWREVTLIS